MRWIIAYQQAMDGRPSPCRFTPSCSSYALEALARRWGVPPWELERAPARWIHRGMTFMKLESEARRGR